MNDVDGPARRIVEFRRDDAGDWIAVLECGHTRHFRDRPPWEVREWVRTEEGRRSRLGMALPCPGCKNGMRTT